MGGPISGSLANIYLGQLEKEISETPGILLYRRFMEDICIITTFTDNEMSTFIENLHSIFSLNITAKDNRNAVNFLDITIRRKKERFLIQPFSKRYLHLPFPLLRPNSSISENANIITSQILRMWRICNDDVAFTRVLNKYLTFLLGRNRRYLQIRKRIFAYLRPLKNKSHQWGCSIPLCDICKRRIMMYNIKIAKIHKTIGKMHISLETDELRNRQCHTATDLR